MLYISLRVLLLINYFIKKKLKIFFLCMMLLSSLNTKDFEMENK